MPTHSINLWKSLWEYDPNGLVVFNKDLNIQVVNPAFCELFQISENVATQSNLTDFFEDLSGFQEITIQDYDRIIREAHLQKFDLRVRQVIFQVQDEDLFACIIVDQTDTWLQKNEYRKIQTEAVRRLNELTTKQMKVAQKIASLLGETTAETKVNVLKLQGLLDKESH